MPFRQAILRGQVGAGAPRARAPAAQKIRGRDKAVSGPRRYHEGVREAPLIPVAFFEEDTPMFAGTLLVPSWLEAEILTAMLESAASEHASRQRAMKAATDNADELIKTLRRVMNRARQDAITTEIMEIVGGAEALRSESGRAVEHSGMINHFVSEEARSTA